MGGGTKEKVARLAAESRLTAELIGMRALLLLMFVCLVVFCMSLAVNLSMALESPAQQAALFAKMAKDKAERAERWRKRNDELLALEERSRADPEYKMKRESEEDTPPWASPRDSKQQKKKKKKLNEADDEVDSAGDDEAEMEIRTKMGEWMREAALIRSSAMGHEETPGLIALRKRQQFVEDGLDAVTAPDELDEFDLKSLLDTDITSDGNKESDKAASALEAFKSKQEEREEEKEDEAASKPFVGVSATNPAIKALRSSNFFTVPSAKNDKGIANHLASLGYAASTVTGSKQLPFWVLQYGLKCPEIVDPTERHILICPFYFPTSPGSRYLGVHTAVRMPKSLMDEVLLRSAHKRGDAKALAQALAEVYDSSAFAPQHFRLFKDKAKLESHLARDAERRPIFVVSQNDGATQSQLTDNVPSILAGEKRYAAKQLVLKRYSLKPVLWQNRKFVVRTYVVLFNSNPLQALYSQGGVLRASEDFVKPTPGSVETAPASIHFPGQVTTPERHSWRQLAKGLSLRDQVYLKHRMKQIAAYAILSMGAAGKPAVEEDATRSLGIQHLCLDFSLEHVSGKQKGSGEDADDGDNAWMEEVQLESIRTDCPLVGEKEEHLLVDAVNVLAEEMLFRKNRQEPYGFASLPSFSAVNQQRLEILFDEVREKEKGRSLLDALESLVATRTIHSPASASKSSSAQSLTCESPKPVFHESHSFSAYQENVPVCSSMDLDALFSTAAVVGNGEEVDAETFFNSKIERSLQMALRNFYLGNFRQMLQEARLAGFAPCARTKRKSISTVFVPTSKGLSPFALKSFTCGGGSPPRDLVIEIPHPFFDHTRQEGLALFDGPLVKALVMSGTHRCSIAPPSKCTGSLGKPIKTNCAGRQDYQNGDVAHSVENTFWVAHVSISEFLANSLVVSLHSTKQDAFVISDGTSKAVEPSASVARVALGLASAFPSQAIESCNDFEGSPNKRSLTDLERDVCGATNVQGRHMNGAADPCEAKVSVDGSSLKASGRFIHIEQPVQLVKEDSVSLAKGVEKALKEYYAALA